MLSFNLGKCKERVYTVRHSKLTLTPEMLGGSSPRLKLCKWMSLIHLGLFIASWGLSWSPTRPVAAMETCGHN